MQTKYTFDSCSIEKNYSKIIRKVLCAQTHISWRSRRYLFNVISTVAAYAEYEISCSNLQHTTVHCKHHKSKALALRNTCTVCANRCVCIDRPRPRSSRRHYLHVEDNEIDHLSEATCLRHCSRTCDDGPCVGHWHCSHRKHHQKHWSRLQRRLREALPLRANPQ